MSPTAPGWQTEDLQDEWPEEEEEEGEEENNLSYGTQSVSFTAPLSTQIHATTEFEPDATPSGGGGRVGTFVVREDVTNAPLMPKTPGRNKKGMIKDFFTPLPLERMFEPPSPANDSERQNRVDKSSPVSSYQNSVNSGGEEEEEEDEIVETDMPNMNSFHGRKASLDCQFTFAVPRATSSQPTVSRSTPRPQAQSTPTPPLFLNRAAPPTDPRLRLFQFQYDTYTREHLSALVDSIAVGTSSGTGTGTTATPTSFNNGLSRVSEVTSSSANMSHMRSTKRIKLSPSSELYDEDSGSRAIVTRPKINGKDYVGESRSLMEKIKQARDYSTGSTVASAQKTSPTSTQEDSKSQGHSIREKRKNYPSSLRRPSFLAVPEQSSDNPLSSRTVTPQGSSYSSSSYRQKAAALMDQIKQDVKRQKRVVSGDSEMSHVTTHVEQDTSASFGANDKVIVQVQESNRHPISSRRSSTSKSNLPRSRASPRKHHKRTADDAELAHNLSYLSIKERAPIVNIALITPPPSNVPPPITTSTDSEQAAAPRSTLAPPSYPSIRANTNEDLNRFVSSSTASGTTLNAGSAPSFVKHAGPAHIRTIAPADLPSLPERFGDMMFDKVMMRWVKNTARATMHAEKSASQADDLSEDPFGDIESLHDESNAGGARASASASPVEEVPIAPAEMSRISEHSEVEDEEELELSNFSTDAPARVVNIMPGAGTNEYEDQTTDSEDDDGDDLHTATQGVINDIDFDSEFEDSPSRNNIVDAGPASNSQQQLVVVHNRGSLGLMAGTPMKSALKSNSVTPTSALRNTYQQSYQTPNHRKPHHRSVSFSDGKRDGPIQGISASGGSVHSIRSKRIADMMNALEDTDFLDEDESPSKSSSSERPEELQPLSARHPANATASGSKVASPRRVFSRTYSQKASPGREQGFAKANGTFLTECSFGVAHDRLVEVITDVQPFEPHWEELSSIDLSKAKLESVARLKEFLPRLDSLCLNHNDLAWLSGIPASVRTLSVSHNCLTGITSYNHLLNLENLDISHNEVESLRQLECLRHLRELRADGNKITSADGLQRMDGLVKLSLQGNLMKSIDFGQYRWTRLEMLNVSHNRLDSMQGVSSLQSLIALNADMNSLNEFTVDGAMNRLRILRVSGNGLKKLDVGSMVNIRTLYADNNGLAGLAKVDRLTKLENLSVRNQSGRGLRVLTRDVRDAKRLYLSGNPMKSDFLVERCYNLVYLELAACRLTTLPAGMAGLVPNVRVLNLNYNFLEDVRGLEGLARLQKLTIIGSRLKHTKPLIRLLRQMPDMEMVDFRMNPCTLGWYLPLLVKDAGSALEPSGRGGEGWQELDSKFRRDLPDGSYIGRLAYRGLIMQGCRRIRMVDGVGVSEKERMKAQKLLEGILGSYLLH